MTQAEREVYAGRVVTLRLKYVPQPNGELALREVVEHAPGAAVVAIDDTGQVLLVRQPRPAIGGRLLELPAGLVERGEDSIQCARRELAEETGYSADHFERLVSFYTSPGFSTERIDVFLASGVRKTTGQPADEQEAIELVRLPLERAIEQVLSGELSDAKTIAGLLACARRGRRA